MHCFAYGSNMCTGRLRHRRIYSAKPKCVGYISQYSFRFHKRGMDRSGKGDAFFTGSPKDIVWGVVFQISSEEEATLDAEEGLGRGYRKVEITVVDRNGVRHPALMYAAEESHISPYLRPYSWYKRFVIEGARQHDLPAEYISLIEAMPAIEDQDRARDARERAILC